MNNPEREQINRRFAELCGLCWHDYIWHSSNIGIYWECRCGHKITEWNKRKINPDFIADPRLVLREMRWRKDWNGTFIYFIGGETHSGSNYRKVQELIPVDYILDETEGLLVLAAIEFLPKTEVSG